MGWYYIVIALLTVLLGIFLTGFHRLRRHNQRLEDLLKHTTEKLERLQVHFGRFTPEEVIEHLTEAGSEYRANMRTVTVLFADLKGFTKMCNDLEPQLVVDILNGYFRCMSEAITKHHGQITELLGDGLLALFGALRSNPWQVQDAVLSAISMREELEKYNQTLMERGIPPLQFGVGIHHGNVLAGVMGNYELSKFGVVGDTINTAARIEALTRDHDCDILISDNVRKRLDGRFRLKEMPALPVKGIETPVVTYLVEGLERHQ